MTAGGSDRDTQWWSGDTASDQALRQHAARHRPQADITLGRLCPNCAGCDHGRPWVRVGPERLAASLSRCGPHLITLIAPNIPDVGVDLEATAEVSRRITWGDIAHPTDPEPPADQMAEHLTRTWAAKEAILKARGTGLLIPMTDLALADYQLVDLPAPDGYHAVACIDAV